MGSSLSPGSLCVPDYRPGLGDIVPGQDLIHATGDIIEDIKASSYMEELTDLGSTEASTRRGQEAGMSPADCTGAVVGEQTRWWTGSHRSSRRLRGGPGGWCCDRGQGVTSLREVIWKKKLLPFGHCPKGGGANPNPKVLG